VSEAVIIDFASENVGGVAASCDPHHTADHQNYGCHDADGADREV